MKSSQLSGILPTTYPRGSTAASPLKSNSSIDAMKTSTNIANQIYHWKHPMTDAKTDRILDEIWNRSLSAGGFAARPGGGYRPDATAWAVLALRTCGIEPQRLHGAMLCLSVQPDGGWSCRPVCRSSRNFLADAVGCPRVAQQPRILSDASLAPQFLLKTTGNHFKRPSVALVAMITY